MTMYLLLTRNQELLAKSILEKESADGIMQMRITEGKAEAVAEQKIICAFGSDSDETPMQCKILEQTGCHIRMQKMMTLNPELRRSYRIPADFDSFLYPVSGQWNGRKHVKAVDISCGGISFYAADGMETGEVAEIVIPNIRFPVIVKIKILRKDMLSDGRAYYGCKFIDLCKGEEESVCRSVFAIQIAYRKKGTARNYTI